jgi:putative aminopeptidase FrvX
MLLTSTDLGAVQHAGTREGSAVVASVGEIQSRITTGAKEDIQKGKDKDVCGAIGTVRSEVLSEKENAKNNSVRIATH